MASDSSLKELHTIINEPWSEDFCSINNKSGKNNACLDKILAQNRSTSTIMNQISDILFRDTYEEIISCHEEASIRAMEKLFYDILTQECSSPNQKNSENSTGDSNDLQFGNNISNASGSILCSTKCNDDGFATQIQKATESAMNVIPNIRSNESFSLKNKKGHNDAHEERYSKQIAIFSDELIRNEEYERVLHFQGEEYIEEIMTLRKLMIKGSEDDEQKEIKGSKSSNAMVKKRTKKGLISDLRPLLILCSQAVCINDHNTTNELIKKIRKHSSPKGDWSERLAHYFVNGLEARLAGTGSEIYHKHFSNQANAIEVLMAYRGFFTICPYARVAFYLYNQAILNVSKNASKVHIIEFCTQFGFHWLSLFECLSLQEGTPPKIKITGVDNPKPGFRPAQRIKDTGRRLADYAKSFNIPFEYNGIVSKLEDLNIDDLNIKNDEVIVIYLPHPQKLGDETVLTGTDSPRDKFLKTIRRMKPNLLIHGVENSSYSNPFFDMRFKQALFHYSSLFDMLDSNMPRENEERIILESRWLGPSAINAIACEGSERVERPESYKKWQARNIRAGFVQLPVDRGVLKKMQKLVKELYHKEFLVDEDNNWVVLGWKGRILFAESTWKCNDD